MNKEVCSPDWCGSVGWVSSPKAKGCGFDSWSGHAPGLQVQSWVGTMFLSSVSPALPLSLKVNKWKIKEEVQWNSIQPLNRIWNLLIWNNIDGLWGCYAEWNKSDRERQIPQDLFYKWNLKNKNKKMSGWQWQGIQGVWNEWRWSKGADFQLKCK